MAAKYNRVSFLLMVACLAVLKLSAGTVYIVGDSTGWSIPTSSSFYSNWASSKTFKVGDTLEFDFTTGQHTVAEVTKSAYDACSTGSPISLKTSGPANFTISSSGAHYYICTIAGHCSAGQKLTITATGTTTTAPSPAPTTTPPTKSPAPSPKAPAPAPKTAAPGPSKTPKSAPSPSPSSTTTPPPSSGTPSPGSPSVPSGSPSVPSSPSPASGPSSTSTPPPPPSGSGAPAGAVASLFFSSFSIVAAAFLY